MNCSQGYAKWIIIGILVLLVAVVVMQCMGEKKEAFEFSQDNYIEGISSRPQFYAPVEVRSNLPEMSSQPLYGDVNGGANFYGAAGPTPLSASMLDQGVQEGFAFLGGGYGGAQAAPNTALSSQQASDMLGQQVNGGKPDYYQAELPLGDIHQVGMDPTDPQNFMYNRTVFAPLKRQYGAGVDFFRGDIDVKQEFRGWFDARPATSKDVQKGYFDRYIDIQQEMALKDAQWTRATPVETLYNASISPAANQFVAYANV